MDDKFVEAGVVGNTKKVLITSIIKIENVKCVFSKEF